MKKKEKYNDSKTKKTKKKRGSIDKKPQIKESNINSVNFWDIDNIDNDELNNININITSIENNKNKTKTNSFFNKYKNRSVEKEKEKENNNKTFHNIIKSYDKYNNNNNNYNGKINLIPYNKEKKYNRNNSVDMNKINKKKNKNLKIDRLSVFERNKKWLETRKEKLDKATEKYINKKEKELENTLEYRKYKNNTDINNIFNEEDNVTLRPENYKFFVRLIQGRQERERALDLNSNTKINCLKKSHYSGKHNGNISQKEMKQYIKYIHNELKDTTNQN